MNISLRRIKRSTVGAQVLLISPAALFMTSLLLRKVGALQSEPARTAQQIVSWYSERMWTLWGLLIALPLVVLGGGCTTLLRSWHEDPDLRRAIREPGAAMDTQLATVGIAVVSLAAGGVLVVVVGHMLAN